MNTLYQKNNGHWDESLGNYVKTLGGVGHVIPTGAVATTTLVGDYYAINAFDPATSLIGSWYTNTWSTPKGYRLTQKINAAYAFPMALKRLVINNFHHDGGLISSGVENCILYGTNVEAAYLNTVYANLDNLTEIQAFVLAMHSGGNVADPQEITIPTTIAPFQYYVFRCANNYLGNYLGLRQVDMYFEKPPWQESQENYIKLGGVWQ